MAEEIPKNPEKEVAPNQIIASGSKIDRGNPFEATPKENMPADLLDKMNDLDEAMKQLQKQPIVAKYGHRDLSLRYQTKEQSTKINPQKLPGYSPKYYDNGVYIPEMALRTFSPETLHFMLAHEVAHNMALDSQPNHPDQKAEDYHLKKELRADTCALLLTKDASGARKTLDEIMRFRRDQIRQQSYAMDNMSNESLNALINMHEGNIIPRRADNVEAIAKLLESGQGLITLQSDLDRELAEIHRVVLPEGRNGSDMQLS